MTFFSCFELFQQPTPWILAMARINLRGAWALGSRPLVNSGAAFGRISYVFCEYFTYLTLIANSVFLLLRPLLLPAPRPPRQRSRGQHPFREAPTVVKRLLLLCLVGLWRFLLAVAGRCFRLASLAQPFGLFWDSQLYFQRLSVLWISFVSLFLACVAPALLAAR